MIEARIERQSPAVGHIQVMQSEKIESVPSLLRVGILLTDTEQPYWVHEAIRHVRASGAATVTALFLPDESLPEECNFRVAEDDQGWNHALYRLLSRFDERKFIQGPDALASSSILPLLEGVPRYSLRVCCDGGKLSLHDENDLRQIKAQGLDILLYPGEKDHWTSSMPRLARYGLWAFHFGNHHPLAFWEAVEGIATIPSSLYICADETSEERRIYSSMAPGGYRSPAWIRNHIYLKTARFAARKMKQLHQQGEAVLATEPEAHSLAPLMEPKGNGIPSNPQMIGASLRILSSPIKNHLKHKLGGGARWDMLFRFGGDPLDPKGSFVIPPPENGFWADPFPWKQGDDYYLFFEELLYAENKGRLRVIELRRDGSWSEPVTVLERDYHLSYPFLFEWEGELFMLPETMQNNTIEVYRCVSFPNQWTFHKILMKDIRAVDATLLQKDGRWWMFVSLAIHGGEIWDEVSLFYADTPFGPWTLHPGSPIRSDVRSARPAGGLFTHNGRLYRPAQDCSVRYGYALTINEVKQLDTERYEETETKRIVPDAGLGELGIHTINRVGELVVFDRFAPRARGPIRP